jgi:hypothetical protein
MGCSPDVVGELGGLCDLKTAGRKKVAWKLILNRIKYITLNNATGYF